MFFNAALFSSLLLAFQVPAAPSGSGPHPLVLSANAVASATPPPNYVPNWAGAFMDGPNGSFTSVTGTFTVPTLANSNGSVAIWVGVDGISCSGVLYHAGVSCSGQPPLCSAWHEWTADNSSQAFQYVNVSAGDVVKLTVNASSETSGTARIDNESTGQWEIAGRVFPTPICGQTAEWIVEDYTIGGELVLLANFGNVTFTNAQANNSLGESWGPGVASILEIKQNTLILTNVSITDNSVTIEYV